MWLVAFIRESVDLVEIGWVFLLGRATVARALILIGVASVVWVPIGVWIGLRRQVADLAQPIVPVPRRLPGEFVLSSGGAILLRHALGR